MKVDVLVDVQMGDCGKGKVAKSLAKKYHYDAICKFNGGPNAGHAVWIGNKKHTAHMLTSGVYYTGCDVIVGPGCVVNPEQFLKEYKQFDKTFNLKGRVFIHPNTHVITADHLREDGKDTLIGTTRMGVGPAYADKYRRTGIQAKTVPELNEFTQSWPTLHFYDRILMEGSQGFWLDIDHGRYPYVTSSHIHPAHAFTTFGIPMQNLGTVWGVGKVYETYVGNNENMVTCDREEAMLIRDVGNEFGETTGRPRKIGYLNLPRLITACNMVGVNRLVLNKMDVLAGLEIFKVLTYEGVVDILEEEPFMAYIAEGLRNYVPTLVSEDDAIMFSGDKERVEALEGGVYA